MKRCLKCDFLYEDDQNLCDMDGGELVTEPTLYPAVAGNPMIAAESATKPPLRSFTLTAAVTVALVMVLMIGFYGFTSRTTEPESSTPASATQDSVTEAIVVEPAAVAPDPVETAAVETLAPAESPEASSSPVKKRNTAVATKQATMRPSTSEERVAKKEPSPKAKEEEKSKVGSILKKTGRALKKPFKF